MTKTKKLVDKILTHELFQRDRAAKTRGPVAAQCIGWDAVDAFLRLQGTALVRTEHPGIGKFVQFPEGWDGYCVNMENIFEEN